MQGSHPPRISKEVRFALLEIIVALIVAGATEVVPENWTVI